MKQVRDEKGFSMIELIVVVAIMAIIGAVLVPQFSTMSARARLTTDATTVKTFQSQVEAYVADIGTTPTGLNANATVNAAIVGQVVAQGYLQRSYLTSAGNLRFQTPGATCVFDATSHHCVLHVPAQAFNTLRPADPNRDTWIVTP